MILTINKEGKYFMVDDKTQPGPPVVGRGRSFREAIGDWFFNHQADLAARFGIRFDVDPSAQSAEGRRRRRELAKR
jgi:hypothetical protein